MAGGGGGGVMAAGVAAAASVVLRSSSRSLTHSLACSLPLASPPSSRGPSIRTIVRDVPVCCIPRVHLQFHCVIFFREHACPRPCLHASSRLGFPCGRWRERANGEQKEEGKEEEEVRYNASMRHLDCYSWSWPCLICTGLFIRSWENFC